MSKSNTLGGLERLFDDAPELPKGVKVSESVGSKETVSVVLPFAETFKVKTMVWDYLVVPAGQEPDDEFNYTGIIEARTEIEARRKLASKYDFPCTIACVGLKQVIGYGAVKGKYITRDVDMVSEAFWTEALRRFKS